MKNDESAIEISVDTEFKVVVFFPWPVPDS